MSAPFLQAIQTNDFFTENGAISHSTTGDALLDYFSKSATFRNRELGEVNADVSRIFAESPMIATMIVFYNRLVTRRTKGFYKSETIQKGQGNRDEFRKAITWLASYHPDSFYENLWLVPEVGTWKDLWHEDTINHLDREQVFELIKRGIENDHHAAMIAKYLPRFRSKSKKSEEKIDYHNKLNQWIHALCKELGWSKKDYRKFKASGSAHEFQRKMCAGKWDELDFKKIPGRALHQLVQSRGKDRKTTLERHNIENKYINWLEKQPTAKFTGYVYELYKAGKRATSLAQKHTLNKQFEGLLELARENREGLKENVWCAIDTSASMTWERLDDSGTQPIDVCVGLGIYFSSLNEGAFKDHVVAFSHISRVIKLSGSFYDKMTQVHRINAWGNTNFQSVIDEIVRVKQTTDIPADQFPTTLLVISDMQFDATGKDNTNYAEMMAKLKSVGLPPIRVIWWWVTGRGKDFPSKFNDEGVTMIGGFDPTIISLLLGGEQKVKDKETGKKRDLNPYENMLKALDQEVLRQIKV